MRLEGALHYTAVRATPDSFQNFTQHIDPIQIEEALAATGVATLRRRRLPAAQVLWIVLREVVVLVTIGIAAGVPAAWLLKRLIASILFDVPALDPMAVAAATVLMALVALLAGYLPARRATKVDPMVALRHE